MTSEASGMRVWGLVLAMALPAALGGCAGEASSAGLGNTPAQTASTQSPGAADGGTAVATAPGKADALAATLFWVQSVEKLGKTASRVSLGITPEQVAQIGRLGDAAETLQAEVAAMPAEAGEEHAKRYGELTRMIEGELRAILSTDQFDALRQAVVQQQIGSTVFLMPGVARTVGLTDRQLATIRAGVEAHLDELQPRNFTVWNIRNVIALGRKLRARAEALLDEEQQERWQSVLDGAAPLAD